MDYSEYTESLYASWERARHQLDTVMLGGPLTGQPFDEERWVLCQELRGLLRKLDESAEVDLPSGWNFTAAPVRQSLLILLEVAEKERPENFNWYRQEVTFAKEMIVSLFSGGNLPCPEKPRRPELITRSQIVRSFIARDGSQLSYDGITKRLRAAGLLNEGKPPPSLPFAQVEAALARTSGSAKPLFFSPELFYQD